MTKKLVVFVHGLGSNTKDAWEAFPRLLTADASVKAHCHSVTDFEYATSVNPIQTTRPLADIAHELAIFITQKKQDCAYDEIAFIAHSQGGLLVRRYLCDLFLQPPAQHPLFSLLTFATPHWGAYSEKASALAWRNEQAKGLAYDSASIAQVNLDWVQTDAEDRVRVLRVVAADDAIVPKFSALGANYANDYRVVPGHGHGSLVKANNADHASYIIAKEFLTEKARSHPALLNVDKTPPVLSAQWQEGREIKGASRFVYTSRYTEFTGRDDEKTQISQFVHQPTADNMAWMWVKGEGGVGKSRLALEFCLAWQTDWHAGFLNRDADAPDWTRWQPRLPTLMVLDYATGDADKLGKILRGLCNRDPSRALRRPVRLLLLDRNQKDDDLNRAIGSGSTAEGVKRCRADDLNLQSTTEPWRIIQNFLKKSDKPEPDKAQTLAALAKIDPQTRPLFAMLVAESLAEGMPLGILNRESLLNSVISRERGQFWEPAAQKSDVSLPKAERLLAFATMVGGLSLKAVAGPLEAWDTDTFAPVFKTAAGYDTGSDTIAPLAPDLLGECFALQQLAQLGDQKAQASINLAWNNWPLESSAFFDRVVQDYGKDNALKLVVKATLNNGVARWAWATCMVNLIGRITATEPGVAKAAFASVQALTKAHPQAAEIQLELAKAAVNLINHITATEPEVAKAAFADLQALAKAYPQAAEIQLRLANAAVNLINRITATEPEVAKAAFADLQALAKAPPQAAEIQLALANAVVNLINHITATEPEVAKAAFADLQALAKAHPLAAEIQLALAKAAFNLISDITATEPEVAKAAFADLQALAKAHPLAAEIQLELANATVNLIGRITATEPEVAKAAFLDLEALSAQRPDDREVLALFLRVAIFMVQQFQSVDKEWVDHVLTKHGETMVEFMHNQS